MLALPIEVVCGGILPHLSVCDLQALDTAFTNKSLRPQLRQVWKSHQYDSFDVELEEDEVMWLCEVDIRIVSLTADGIVEFLAANCPHLEKLSVKYSHESDVDNAVSALAQNCRQLHTLDITSEYLTDAGVTALAQHCTELHTVQICDSAITDAGIQTLCDNCPHLKHVELCNCDDLTDASLVVIANSYPHLESIRLCSDSFTDDGLIYIADKCHELRSVNNWYCDITSRGLTALWAANPNLMDVDISDNDFISDDDIIQLAQCCPLLRKLVAVRCCDITDAAVIAVAEHCPQLRSLDIRDCNEVSDASLIALGQHCHELKSINISYLGNISDVGIAALAAGCPLLQEFFAGNTSITDAGVVALARRCRDLRKIDLNDCMCVGGAGVSAIAENCPLISDLLLSSCKVDDACLYVIAQLCRNLTVLDVSSYRLSDISAVRSVVTSCRLLRVFRCSDCFINKARLQQHISPRLLHVLRNIE